MYIKIFTFHVSALKKKLHDHYSADRALYSRGSAESSQQNRLISCHLRLCTLNSVL